MNKDCCEKCKQTSGWLYSNICDDPKCPCHQEGGNWRERFDKQFANTNFLKKRGSLAEIEAFIASELERVRAQRDYEVLPVLAELLGAYVGLASSGDCGFWDPEEKEAVKKARAVLSRLQKNGGEKQI